MFMSKKRHTILDWVLAIACVITLTNRSIAEESNHTEKYSIGRTATQAEIQAWNIDVSPNGNGLPPGQGTAKDDATVYANLCASCHGITGIEGPMPKLVGGQNSLKTAYPLKTVGSYWPFATTLFDYIYRAMPPTAPQSLSPDEVYSVVAWILFRNGIIHKSSTLDAKSLPAIEMPNNNGFVQDPRPDVYKKHP